MPIRLFHILYFGVSCPIPHNWNDEKDENPKKMDNFLLFRNLLLNLQSIKSLS